MHKKQLIIQRNLEQLEATLNENSKHLSLKNEKMICR